RVSQRGRRRAHPRGPRGGHGAQQRDRSRRVGAAAALGENDRRWRLDSGAPAVKAGRRKGGRAETEGRRRQGGKVESVGRKVGTSEGRKVGRLEGRRLARKVA